MPKKFPFQQEAGKKIEVPETRYAWDLIVTAPEPYIIARATRSFAP
jgi:hypothetical protein